MIDEFFQRVVAALRDLGLQVRIGQLEQCGDEERMGNALRPFQDHAQRLDRLLEVALRKIQLAKQKPLFVPLRRRLRFGFAQ